MPQPLAIGRIVRSLDRLVVLAADEVMDQLFG
jgi:hypothetical protein